MNRMNFSMQSDLFDPGHARPVTVIGVGSVGSNVANMLARIGVERMTIIDGDAVESHNIPASRFTLDDLGYFKADIVAKRLRDEVGLTVKAERRYYEGEERLKGSVFACVDTMSARKKIWSQVKKNPLVDVLIDTRVARRFFTVFCVRPSLPEDIAHYEQFLYDDAEATGQGCGAHGIITASTMVAAEAVERLCAFWSDGSIRLQTEGIVGGERFSITPHN